MVVSPFVRGRFDLSEDGKYTLSESSEAILESIDAPLLVQVYLGGDDLPGGFEREVHCHLRGSFPNLDEESTKH